MSFYDYIKQGKSKISVVGLGYVGMPIAVEFAKKVQVIGFDTNKEKIELYKKGIDPTQEVGNEAIKKSKVEFTSDPQKLREAKLHIIAVPTPINQDKIPDLTPIENASKVVGSNLTKGSIVVYESTVYPGATEEICVPILEEYSGLKYMEDFNIGYSPERINPGDKVNTLKNIVKVVSGDNQATLDTLSRIYEIIIEAGTFKATSIKVAEAAKVVENSQRDINIAFMNELSIVFDKMGISSHDVIDAMNTKWNALKFYPGLVGGHCIGVDPYYFISKAEKLGYHSQIISAGRKINDDMGQFIVESTIKQLILSGKRIKGSKVAILGLTFKENCPDTRNTKVIDIINGLTEYGIDVVITDPYADSKEAFEEYGVSLCELDEINNVDCIVFAVKHREYTNKDFDSFEKMFINDKDADNVVIDVKRMFDKNDVESKGLRYWEL